MAVNSIYAPVEQAGNSVTVAFDFSFKIFAATDLLVYKKDANGVQGAVLVLNTDYTVTFDPVAETGTVTYTVAPVTGGSSLIKRSSNDQQQTSLQREGNMPAKTLETMLDKMMMLIQEILFGSSESPLELSGTYAAKPATPALACYYYSTDRGSYEKWVPAAQRWFLLG